MLLVTSTFADGKNGVRVLTAALVKAALESLRRAAVLKLTEMCPWIFVFPASEPGYNPQCQLGRTDFITHFDAKSRFTSLIDVS